MDFRPFIGGKIYWVSIVSEFEVDIGGRPLGFFIENPATH